MAMLGRDDAIFHDLAVEMQVVVPKELKGLPQTR